MEKLLIELLKNGDFDAFKEVYDRYHIPMVNYFYSKTHEREDAIDLTQDCFCKLWRYRSKLSSNYHIEQQIFFLAKQLVIDYYRKQKNRQPIALEDEMDIPSNEIIHNIISKDLKAELDPILNQMPNIRKNIFVLNKYEGFSYKEIAYHYTLSEKAVENHIYKALRFIKSKLYIVVIIFFT